MFFTENNWSFMFSYFLTIFFVSPFYSRFLDSTRYRSDFQGDLWGSTRIQFGRYYISPFVSVRNSLGVLDLMGFQDFYLSSSLQALWICYLFFCEVTWI